MKYTVWIIVLFFFASALYIFALFGLPLIGRYIPYPLLLFKDTSNPYSTWSFLVLLNLLPFFGIIVSYVVFVLYAVISTYIPHLPFSKKFLHEYKKYELLHKISLVLSLPFLFPFGFVLFTSFFFHSDIIFGPVEIVLGIMLWMIWLRFSRAIFSKILGIVAVSLAIWGVFFFMSESIPEFYPSIHGKFPLNDSKGVYLINYDGDYWLTYYIQEQFCINKNTKEGTLEKACKINLVKEGNTVITEAPFDLKKYLDKPVRVQGTFVPVMPPVPPGNGYRQFCVTKPSRSCITSHGPGTWYYSPLKIDKVSFVQ